MSTSTNLLKRVIAGEQEAWCKFVGIYSALIYSRCRRRGVGEADSADLVQNVLVRVFKSIGSFRRDQLGQGLRRWLKTIARNVISDYLREAALGQHGIAQSDLAGLLADIEASDDGSISDPNTEPASVVILRPVLDAMKIDYEEKTWQAFWRTAVDAEPTADVAADLGISQGTVRQARYKILKRLRDELQELEDLL